MFEKLQGTHIHIHVRTRPHIVMKPVLRNVILSEDLISPSVDIQSFL